MKGVEYKPLFAFQLKTKTFTFLHVIQSQNSNFGGKGKTHLNFWKRHFLLYNDGELKLSNVAQRQHLTKNNLKTLASFLPPLFFFHWVERKVLILNESKVWRQNEWLNNFWRQYIKTWCFSFFSPKKSVIENVRDHVDVSFIFFGSI